VPRRTAKNRWYAAPVRTPVVMRDKSFEKLPPGGQVAGAASSPTRALILATISFAISFAAWGLVGGLASVFTGLYSLTASETALLVSVPVRLL